MKSWVRLLPLAVFLFILPFPGTVTLRLLALALGLTVSACVWHQEGFPQVPARNALLFWLGCALFSLVTAVDPAYSLGEIKNEIGYAMAAYLAFLTLTRTRADAAFLLGALVLGTLALAALALWEYVLAPSSSWNERGLAGGSGGYSTYLLALLPTLLWAGTAFRHKHRWNLIAGLVVLQLVIAVLTGQRAFWLAFALQVLIALYLLQARGFVAVPAPRMRAIAVTVVFLSALVIVSATLTRGVVTTNDPRITAWPAITLRILEQPLSGKGFGRETMKKAYPDLVSKEFPLFWHAHNVFLNYGMSMGIPGLIAIVWLFFALLKKFWVLSRDVDRVIAMAGICGALLVAGVVARNFTNDFFQRDLALLFWAISGMLLGYAAHAKTDAQLAKAAGA
jgi:O-antigen ligase